MSLQPFTFPDTGQTVRSLQADDGPWFVAADVAAVLGYRMASDLTRRLDDDERGTRSVRTLGGDQPMTVITESGLYSAILGSKIPQARAFKRWVTREVLPTIHRTGRYEVAPRELDRRALAEMVIAEADRADVAEQRAAALAPAAEAWGDLADASGDYSVRQAAQILSRTPGITVGQRRLFAHLRGLNWIDRTGQPYQSQVDAGRLVRRTTTYTHPHTEEPMLSAQVRVTPKGVAKLRSLLAADAQLTLDGGTP
ncbi:phage antirepressor KilAC domain-containing protein [Nocardiopsis synnemataformans]|uniref:phage antirepressor KilAC domain-containing protein n=1 Tax=Nocardiopsis synnemataformans TaxID=61305 RepID=UPI003EC06384